MATPPIVKKIGKLAGFGVFPNFTCPGEVPDFKTHNLIYGFNGSGKTTLSRVFSSLERGAPEAALPPDCKFEIELDNGVVISESANLDYLKKRILVFNVDFVERNLQWSAGKAEPVFYIGEEQAELGARLAESEAKAASLRDALNAERKEAIANAKLLADNKTNTARLIAEQLNYGRRYNATNLFDDYEVQNYGEEFVLSDDDLDQQKRIFNQSEALPELHPIEELGFACSKWALYTHRALESTIGTLVAADLQKHSAMLSWLKTGVEYHEHHALTECLLCGNTLKPERLNAVKQSVDSQTGRLVQLFPELIETAKEMLRKLDAIPSRPAPEYVTPDLRALYDVAVKSIADAHSKLRNLIQEGIVRLEKRVANILRAEAQGDHFILASKGKLDEIASECHNTYNVLVRQHNAKMADFQRTKATAEKSLKRHYLAQNQTSYNELLKTVAVLEEQARISNRKYELVEREIADIQTALRKHGKAAEKITKMVQNYLGHSELEILAVEGGYEIRRYKKALAGSLSEGEKTAIALCYFLCTLEAENRKISDLVVVIDDPISSLDTKALHYALSVVRSAVGLSGQLIFYYPQHPLHAGHTQVVEIWRSQESPYSVLSRCSHQAR